MHGGKCTCGCGEECNDEFVWYRIDGQPFATLECWEAYAHARIAKDIVRLEDGTWLPWEQFKTEYEVRVNG